ncbi:MAG: SagB/ThcOx family dehydrogenase [Dehalococcoidales bacterium]
MKLEKWLVILIIVISLLTLPGCGGVETAAATSQETTKIVLPEPKKDSDTSIEEALWGRRSTRNFSAETITLEQVSQLIWAGQGITDPSGKRTAPSAGALYPLKLYVFIGNVTGAAAGVYVYDPATHSLTRIIDGDQRQALTQAAMGQTSVKQGAIDIVITANYSITTKVYGERGIRFVHLEAGHAAQNICLQAVGLKLATVTVGAFDDASVQHVLGLPDAEVPLYIIPAGNFAD